MSNRKALGPEYLRRNLWLLSAFAYVSRPDLQMRFFAALLLPLVCLFALPAVAQDHVARGRYLTVLGDCAGCHTSAHGPAYAGGLPFNAQFGTVYSTNITPDRKTGIGDWTADQFYRALHDGIAANGRHLYPAFPYAYFTRITRQDTDDLFAYLKTLKPVHQPPTPNRLIFPFNIRWGLTFWNWLYLDKTPPRLPANASPQWKRGEYLVNGLGHCAGCHTPKDILFGDKKDKALTGSVVDNWFSANLTGGDVDGLGKWSHAELVKYLATGRNTYATAAGSMQEKVTSSTSHMSDSDRAAIATYLKSLAPRKLAVAKPPHPDQMRAGEVVFVQHCVICHQPPGKPDQPGTLPDYPKLAGDTLIMGRDPTTVLRIILEGAPSPVTPNQHTTFSMPSFATLTDDEIADAATYIRNSWGNSASPVAAGDVKRLRARIQ
jgi:mono/diheme cytochrome c family protein